MKKSVIRAKFNGGKKNGRTNVIDGGGTQTHVCRFGHIRRVIKSSCPRTKKIQKKFIYARESAFCEELDNHYVDSFKLGLLIGIEAWKIECLNFGEKGYPFVRYRRKNAKKYRLNRE